MVEKRKRSPGLSNHLCARATYALAAKMDLADNASRKANFALMLNKLFSNNSAYISKQIPYIVNYYNYSHNTVRPGSSYPNLYNKLLYKLDQPLTGHTVPHTSMGETHHMIHLFIIISSFLSVHKI